MVGYLKGHLLVRADSRFTERFINICMHRGIPVRDIKRCGNNRIIFKTDINTFKEIRLPARRTKSSVKIIKRCGLPFVIKRYKKKRLVIISSIIILGVVWFASNHVLGITVFGNNRISTDVIRGTLRESGLKLGMKTEDVVANTIRNNMMSKLSDLAWVGINANGSRVYIEIVERIEKEEGIDKNAPACDLVAKCDGEIEKIEIREGQAVVNIGSGVRKGDVLVSGIVDNPIDGFTYVHARGDVFAKTRYIKTRAYPLSYIERIKTGKKKTRFSLLIKDKKINIFKNKPFKYYDLSQKEIGNDIKLIKESYEEVLEEKKNVLPQEALKKAEEELYNEFLMEKDEKAEVIERNVTYTISEKNEILVTLEIILRENIAKEYIVEVPVRE